MPVSRISSFSLSPSFVTLQIFASLKKIYVSRQKLFSRTPNVLIQQRVTKNGIKTLIAKNSRHCDGENDDDDGKNYGTSH